MHDSAPRSTLRTSHFGLRAFLWLVFYVLDGVLLVLFGLGYANAYLPFGVAWWMELVAIGLPYCAVLLVPAALVAALGRRRRLLVLHGLALLLVLVRLVPVGRLLGGNDPGPDDLTVLTFNVPSSRITPEGMAALVRTAGPHIVCLQEAMVTFVPNGDLYGINTRPDVDLLLDSLGFAAPVPEGGGYQFTPQPVFSRIPVASLVRTVLTYRPDEAAADVVRAELQWQGRPFVLYNLHLRSFGERKPWQEPEQSLDEPRLWRTYLRQYREAFALRAWEVEQIQALLARETLPVVLCGDFNSTPYNRAYERLADGRRDAFHDAGSGWGMTYHGRLPFARIDFVLADPAWDVVAARVPPVYLSDHRPLMARLRWRVGSSKDQGRSSK